MCSSPSSPGFDEIASGPWNSERLYSSKASSSSIGFEIHSTFKNKNKNLRLKYAINVIPVQFLGENVRKKCELNLKRWKQQVS